MKTSKWALAAALAATFSAANAADLHSVALSHYEPINQLQMRAITARAANASEAPGLSPVVMSFDALGQSFDLELEPNHRLLSTARQSSMLDGVEIYRGELAGKPGSWARIVVANGAPSGMFWDGTEMYAIEAPGDSLVNSNAPVIFRLADVQVAPGSMSCGSAPMAMTAMTGTQALEGLVSELGIKAEADGAIDEIGLGVIGDFEFTDAKGGDAAAAAAITTRLNNVDGIFSSQLGIQITVNTIETFSSAAADPFTDETDASLLLDEVSDYRSATPAQNSNGLTHLYTGKNLDGTTVGIAYTGALCSNFFGTGLSEGNGSATFDSLVAAHEIGHNFGAPHDGEAGSACEAEVGDWLMSPRLNGSDTFSQCSIDEMSDDIARASCITALPAVDLRPKLTSGSSVLFGTTSVLTYDIANVGSIGATGVTVDFAIPANLTLDAVSPSQGTCTSTAVSASCAIGDVPGQATRTVDITTTPTALGAGTITATVFADVDDRASNDQEAMQVSVDPAVDLAVTAPARSSVRVDRSTTITATLENIATLDATNVTVSVDIGSSLLATSASWPLGTCSVMPQQVTCQAAQFAASSSTTVSVTASGVSTGTPRVTYSLASAEPDLVPTNNSGSVRIEVRDPDDDGGGSTGPLFLLLLSLAAVLRRRR
jgi:MYXO-CTERM domain-containing protein